ncbi:hypothetical protein EDD22DRAFT_998070 [Suillus occidentalis]|nr:hypothetical protein EDD22DRAFT_998070 [Suillus occidentalis]
MERMRVAEVIAARDTVVERLEDAYVSVWQKSATIDRLQRELDNLRRPCTPATSMARDDDSSTQLPSKEFDPQNDVEPLPLGDGPENSILARQALLATLPLPADIPDDALSPILIPQPYTLHEFLGNASGTLKSSLSNYRVLGQLTTYWCPEREEHGYLLTPVFKCSTNPRVTTAHRWTAVDVIGTMDRPTECFYNKDGKWYYAGVYKAFRMDDLTTEEWEALSTETTQTLIKETLAGRKNLSPQNLYETGQLYAVGALRVACIGLQCVGFSSAMYRAVLEQAALGKWRGIGWSGPYRKII